MKYKMTRQEFDLLPSGYGTEACPDCGERTTHPHPGCGCPPSDTGYGTKHIMKYHHTCNPNVLEEKDFDTLCCLLEEWKRKNKLVVEVINESGETESRQVERITCDDGTDLGIFLILKPTKKEKLSLIQKILMALRVLIGI